MCRKQHPAPALCSYQLSPNSSAVPLHRTTLPRRQDTHTEVLMPKSKHHACLSQRTLRTLKAHYASPLNRKHLAAFTTRQTRATPRATHKKTRTAPTGAAGPLPLGRLQVATCAPLLRPADAIPGPLALDPASGPACGSDDDAPPPAGPPAAPGAAEARDAAASLEATSALRATARRTCSTGAPAARAWQRSTQAPNVFAVCCQRQWRRVATPNK